MKGSDDDLDGLSDDDEDDDNDDDDEEEDDDDEGNGDSERTTKVSPFYELLIMSH